MPGHDAGPWKSTATASRSSTATSACACWRWRRSVASGSRQARCRRCCPSTSSWTASASWCAPVRAASSMPRCRTSRRRLRGRRLRSIHHSGWSVAVTGLATEVMDPIELDRAHRQPVARWAPAGARPCSRSRPSSFRGGAPPRRRQRRDSTPSGERVARQLPGPAIPGRCPWAHRRGARIVRRGGRRGPPCSSGHARGASPARWADPVVDHPQHDLLGHHHLDLHRRRPGVAGDVAERLPQGGEQLGEVVVRRRCRRDRRRSIGVRTRARRRRPGRGPAPGRGGRRPTTTRDDSSLKMADRMCFTVRSRSSTAASMRVDRGVGVGPAPAGPSPAATGRWRTGAG